MRRWVSPIYFTRALAVKGIIPVKRLGKFLKLPVHAEAELARKGLIHEFWYIFRPRPYSPKGEPNIY